MSGIPPTPKKNKEKKNEKRWKKKNSLGD